MLNLNLARQLDSIDPQVKASPLANHEHVNGWMVMVLPFSSGDLLALRVFPEGDFAPFASVWHCNTAGEWSIYNDGPSMDTGCPRYWSPATKKCAPTSINLSWEGPNRLRVDMTNPSLAWTMDISAPFGLRLLNALSAPLPLWTWKPRFLQQARELMAKHFLGMGDIQITGTTASGHESLMMPEQLFFIDSSRAVFEGRDLGHPVQLNENPRIGDIPMPKRPTFAIGQAHALIRDREEYRQTKAQLAL